MFRWATQPGGAVVLRDARSVGRSVDKALGGFYRASGRLMNRKNRELDTASGFRVTLAEIDAIAMIGRRLWST